jgi:hypothetical protein
MVHLSKELVWPAGGALSKARWIWELLQAGKKPNEIAAAVGCRVEYVRVVRQRHLNPKRTYATTSAGAITPITSIRSGSKSATHTHESGASGDLTMIVGELVARAAGGDSTTLFR